MATYDGDNGNNLHIGTPGDDTINGYGGIDLLRGAGGDDEIEGGDGPDSLYGDQGNDDIFGGGGDDVIRGGKGDDVVVGGAGRNVVRGDFGDDVIWVMGNSGGDYIDGGPGRDTLAYVDVTEGVFLWGVSAYEFVKTIAVRGDAADVIENVESFRLTDHDDAVFMTRGAGVNIDGAGGNDQMGAYDSAILYGGPGNDRLTSINGVDAWLLGEGGNDIFVVGRRVRDAPDALSVGIGDFASGEDRIEIGGTDAAAIQAMLDGSTGETLNLGLLGVEGMAGTLTLSGVDVSDLTVDDFILT